MAYATTSDVADRLGRPLTAAELPRVQVLLEDAAALIDAHTDGALVDLDPLPSAPGRVSALMVARVLATADIPAGLESQTVGPFGVRFGAGYTSGGVWLSATDKTMLRSWRASAVSVQLESERPATGTPKDYWRSL